MMDSEDPQQGIEQKKVLLVRVTHQKDVTVLLNFLYLVKKRTSSFSSGCLTYSEIVSESQEDSVVGEWEG